MTSEVRACRSIIKYTGKKPGDHPMTSEEFMALAKEKNPTVVDSIIRSCRSIRPWASYEEIEYIAAQCIYEIAGLDFRKYVVGG